MDAWKKHLSEYYAPKNLISGTTWGTFDAGSGDAVAHWDLADDELHAFGGSGVASVEYIMRDVDFGRLLRYLHSTGASAFFFVV